MDLCGISGHWSFKGVLPSKLSTFPIHKLVMGTEAIDESRLAGAFLSVFNCFRLGLLLRAMCLAPLCPIVLGGGVCPRPQSTNKEGGLELRFTHGDRWCPTSIL